MNEVRQPADPPDSGGDLRELFTEHRVAVGKTVRALLCSSQDSEDLVQEVFAVAFSRLDAFGGRNVSAWLCGIAVNVVRNHRRRAARRQRLDRRFELPSGAIVDPETPERSLATRRLAEQFWAALDRLPDREREAFVLRVVQDKSLLECGEALGANIKTVSRRAVAAERKIRTALGELNQ